MAADRQQGSLIPAAPMETKIFPVLLVGGLLIVLASLAIMGVVATIASDVFSNAKAARDAAEAGSGLLSLQGDLATVPEWLFYFKVTGITLLWLSIIVVLSGIVKTIGVRATVMAESLATIAGRAEQGREREQ